VASRIYYPAACRVVDIGTTTGRRNPWRRRRALAARVVNFETIHIRAIQRFSA
jgi:hypothetical protein